jgi:hypothetical protein
MGAREPWAGRDAEESLSDCAAQEGVSATIPVWDARSFRQPELVNESREKRRSTRSVWTHPSSTDGQASGPGGPSLVW